MTRIPPIDERTADAATAEVLASVQMEMGSVPNSVSAMAHSPEVARAYLGFSKELSGGMLPARLREQIALVVGEANGCDCCVQM